jgi:hypothetical protein
VKTTFFILYILLMRWSSRYIAVAIANGYGLDDRGAGVRIPVGSRTFSSCRADRLWDPPTSCLMGTRGSFPEVKAAGAWSWPFTSNLCPGQENMDLYFHSPIRLHGVLLNEWSRGITLSFYFLYAEQFFKKRTNGDFNLMSVAVLSVLYQQILTSRDICWGSDERLDTGHRSGFLQVLYEFEISFIMFHT